MLTYKDQQKIAHTVCSINNFAWLNLSVLNKSNVSFQSMLSISTLTLIPASRKKKRFYHFRMCRSRHAKTKLHLWLIRSTITRSLIVANNIVFRQTVTLIGYIHLHRVEISTSSLIRNDLLPSCSIGHFNNTIHYHVCWPIWALCSSVIPTKQIQSISGIVSFFEWTQTLATFCCLYAKKLLYCK